MTIRRVAVQRPRSITRLLRLVPLALLALSTPLRAAIPDNDNFATRIRLFGANVSTTGSNVDSTQEPGEPDPSFVGGKSVWWTWTAPADGAVTITTAGSTFDTMLSVFTGDTLTSLNLVAFNDNEATTSSVTFNVTQGTVYQIMVDGAVNAMGSISLQLTLGPTQPPPINDNFADRITISGTHISNVAGNNAGATREAGEPYHADNVGLKSVWWTWTAPASGGLTLTTDGSSFDTVLGIYTGNSVSNLTFVAGNDENPINPNKESLLTCNVTAGTTYQIAVDGFEGDTGDIKLSLDLNALFPVPANDNFANRAVLSGSDVTVAGTNVGASFEAIGADFEQGEPMHLFTFGGHSVWWTWTAPSSAGVTITVSGVSTSGLELDTIAVVYTGNQLSSLQFVAGNDEDYLTVADGDSRVRFNATAGTTYQIAVDGYDGDVGTINLHLFMGTALTVPANNNFANRTSISGNNVNVLGANRGATFEAGEPLHNNSYGGKSIWWSWTSPGPGFVTMDTISSTNSFPDTYFDTILAVYTGSTLATLIPVASDDESGGNHLSLLKFPTRSGVTYQIAVDGYDGDFGDVNLHVAFTSASYSLSLSTNPIAGGSVTISPPPNAGANYAPGTVVTLTATPSAGALFTDWAGSVTSTNNPLAITMNGNKAITAEFYIIPTTRNWTGGSGANANWTTSQNWAEGTPNPGDALVFPAGASQLANNNDFPANTIFKSITFADANYVLSGNSVILNNGILATNATGTNTLALPLQLNSNQTFRCAIPGTKLVLSGNVTLGNRTLTADNGGDIVVSGIISGTAGIIKTNSGTLSLLGTGTNTYSGSTLVNQGTLELGKLGVAVPGPLTIGDGSGGANADVVRFIANSQLASGSAVTISSSGRLDLNGFTGNVGSLNITGGNVDTGSGTLGLNGNVTVNASSAQANITGNLTLQGATRTFNVADGLASTDLMISAVIADGGGAGGINKTGSGRLQLSAANTYTGPTTVTDGTLAVSDSSLGATSQGTTVNNSAVLRLSGTITGEPLTLAGGTLQCDNGNNSWTGNIQSSGNSVVNTAVANGTLTLSGLISGTGNFTKNGDGTLTLSGNLANTYSGTTTINQGTLLLSKTTSNAVAGGLVIGDGSGGADADLVRVDSMDQISWGSAVTVNSSGLLRLNNATNAVGSLSGNGHVDLVATSALSVGNDNSSTSFSGLITGAGSFAKAGGGTLTLGGNNTYTGQTTVNAGQLNINGSQPGSAVLVNASGTLGGAGRVGTVSGSGTISPGSSPGVLVTSNVTFSAGSTYRVELNGSTAGSGYDQLSVTGAVTVAGTLNATLGYSPTTNDSFTIINNDGNDPVVGSFNGLPEGSLLSIGGSQFRISYAAGPGANDVRLTYVVPPQISCSNINTNTGLGLCSRTVAFAANVSTGAPAPTVSYKLGGVSISSPYAFPVGTNVVMVTATNGVPPNASCSFTVIVADQEAPAIHCPTNITVMAAGACPQVVAFSQNMSATDNCSLGNLIASPASGSAFPVGTNVVNVTATDTAGNSNVCSFLVTVLPGPAPELAISRSGDLGVVLSWPASNGCYQLQSTACLVGCPHSNAWTTFSGPLATNGAFIYATNTPPTSNIFYRLFY